MKSFTLLQWNTWYKEKPENILELFSEINPDIACFQELTQNYKGNDYLDVPKYLAEKTGYNYYFEETQYWPTDKGKRVQGNAIISRFTLEQTSAVYIQKIKHDNFDDYTTEGRVLLSADVNLDENRMRVSTTHLSYAHKFVETDLKLQEEQKLLDAISDKKEKFILAGDFNVDEHSKLINDLQNKFKHAGPDFIEKTWTTKPFDYQGFKETELNWRLDYVFCTEDINIISSEVIDTEYSDHLPILIEFNFK